MMMNLTKNSNKKHFYKIISNGSLKSESIKKKIISMQPDNWIIDDIKADYIFVIGGDGTFLRSKKYYGNKKIISINGGNLGYYAFFNCNNLKTIFKKILNDSYYFKPLLIVAQTDSFKYEALNEILVRDDKVLNTNIYLNGVKLEKFKGTGIMVSTPYGSTAHSKNCNGALIEPEQKLIQLIEIEPLTQKKYNSLHSPLIMSADWKIDLKSEVANFSHIIIDGTNEKNHFEKNLKIYSKEAEFYLFKPNSDALYIKKLRDSFVRD